MFDSILIANRGEIACRIIRTARNLGLRTVAVYSEADCGAPHTQLADSAISIGPSPVNESYLCGDKIIAAALEANAGAIHPGYGFLSENAEFAKAVQQAGLTFIGAPPTAISAMGDKAQAKKLMISAGVPCVPGYQDEDQSDTAFIEAAEKIGYPIMVKAAAGGGGRGMRLIHDGSELPQALKLARSEARNAFGSDTLILEKAIQSPRHVEVQIFADEHGHCIHLGERDCSIQRRHQKIVEESPCPVMDEPLRKAMTTAAIAAAKAVDYRGAGTVEFLLENDRSFYFLEMNTRLQVEHPVTEAVTGLDLVEMQISTAQGQPLSVTQSEIKLEGHAIEVRLYAENPSADFLPTTGSVSLWRPAVTDYVRVDHGIKTGTNISPYYDSMLAKVIAHGPDRNTARLRLLRSLEDSVLLGVQTNREFLIDVLQQSEFAMGNTHTGFVQDIYPHGISDQDALFSDCALAALVEYQSELIKAESRMLSSVSELRGWSSACPLPWPVQIDFNEISQTILINAYPDWLEVTDRNSDAGSITAETLEFNDHSMLVSLNGQRISISYARSETNILYLATDKSDFAFQLNDPLIRTEELASDDRVLSPMPGTVTSVSVKPGDSVALGDTLAVIEAMKMQHPVLAQMNAQIETVHVSAGEQVGSGAPMFGYIVQEVKE